MRNIRTYSTECDTPCTDSELDYCDASLSGHAQFFFTDVFFTALYWLPVPACIKSKSLILTVTTNTAPTYSNSLPYSGLRLLICMICCFVQDNRLTLSLRLQYTSCSQSTYGECQLLVKGCGSHLSWVVANHALPTQLGFSCLDNYRHFDFRSLLNKLNCYCVLQRSQQVLWLMRAGQSTR